MESVLDYCIFARLFSSHWHHCWRATDTFVQQSVVQLFNSHWQVCSIVADTIFLQSLTRLLNSQMFLFLALARFFNTLSNSQMQNFFTTKLNEFQKQLLVGFFIWWWIFKRKHPTLLTLANIFQASSSLWQGIWFGKRNWWPGS